MLRSMTAPSASLTGPRSNAFPRPCSEILALASLLRPRQLYEPPFVMATGTEPFSVVRVLLLAGIVGCVIGLKLTH